MLLQLEVGDLLPECSVNIATGLSEALALAKARKPDLIILSDGGGAVDVEHVLSLLKSVAGDQVRFIMVGPAPASPAVPVMAAIGTPVRLSELKAALGLAEAKEREPIREDVQPESPRNIRGSPPAV